MSEVLSLNSYRCFVCKEVFEFGWSDEEAVKEQEEVFPGIPLEECELVCDDCYNNIGPWRYWGSSG